MRDNKIHASRFTSHRLRTTAHQHPIPMKQTFLLILLLALLGGCGRLPRSTSQPLPPLIVQSPPDAAMVALTAVANPDPIPGRDLPHLHQALRGTPPASLPLTHDTLGDVRAFWYKDFANNRNKQTNARLLYQSATLNMWVEEGARVSERDVATAAQVIENAILPTNRALFGPELGPNPAPGTRLNLLHLKKLPGIGIAYFSAADQYSTAVNPYSNQRPMLYVSLQAASLGSDRYYATIAHELQHMSLWHADRNEDAWLSEGLSELAVHVNGYATGREATYARRPDIQLTTLQHDPGVVDAHYAAAFLFVAYFYERFGATAVQALVQQPENGAAGFNAVLAELGTGLTFDDLFADWLVANYLNSIGRQEGVYAYQNVRLPALSVETAAQKETAVHQYGADYLRLTGSEPVTLIFTGTQQVRTIAAAPYSGSAYWLSFPADESEMRLTRAFDLRGLQSATLTFWTWYEIEEGWDYAYVAVSEDGGTSWTLLETQSTTRQDPHGNSFGPGFTGRSATWQQETADLTPFAGREILLRFQYITDDAVHMAGWAIDDIAIPELGYYHDAETDADGWQGEGFARLTAVLPQQFLVQAILLGDGGIQVERLPLDQAQQGRWLIPLGAQTRTAVIVIAGLTPFTRETAVYAYAVQR